jgi:hypothetical protein
MKSFLAIVVSVTVYSTVPAPKKLKPKLRPNELRRTAQTCAQPLSFMGTLR